MIPAWKDNWSQTRQHYLDWWSGKGLVISMWGYIPQGGEPHEPVQPPPAAKDLEQYWFDPQWRALHIHYQLAHSCMGADILPVADTNLGPGSLAAILGAELQAGEDTIWIRLRPDTSDQIFFDQDNKWWLLHLELLRACRRLSEGRYFVGMPDLCEGLDVLVGLRGAEQVFLDMVERPAVVQSQLDQIHRIYLDVFDRIYEIISVDGEMAFCYFSIWGPGKVAKLQCDVSAMISPADFRRFALPYLRMQCQAINYTLYHLDGIDAIRHLDPLLEIEQLKAIQWTPGAGQPQGGDPCWYGLYRRIRNAGKSVMASWVQIAELEPLLDAVGPEGLAVLMDFQSERDIEQAARIAGRYR
ncbi:MAG: hypothetical protein QHH07_04635 [Sedimentisphaerales bacterium]|jgi:hypothetical protein|nr:hypothetical protein [Sedimentisphaerales bacterium]